MLQGSQGMVQEHGVGTLVLPAPGNTPGHRRQTPAALPPLLPTIASSFSYAPEPRPAPQLGAFYLILSFGHFPPATHGSLLVSSSQQCTANMQCLRSNASVSIILIVYLKHVLSSAEIFVLFSFSC